MHVCHEMACRVIGTPTLALRRRQTWAPAWAAHVLLQEKRRKGTSQTSTQPRAKLNIPIRQRIRVPCEVQCGARATIPFHEGGDGRLDLTTMGVWEPPQHLSANWEQDGNTKQWKQNIILIITLNSLTLPISHNREKMRRRWYLLLMRRSLEMKSLASSDMLLNSSSSKFHWHWRMLLRVWLSSSPRNGDRPLRLDKKRAWLNISEMCVWWCVCLCPCVLQDNCAGRLVCTWAYVQILTACTWWLPSSTCLCWTRQTRS